MVDDIVQVVLCMWLVVELEQVYVSNEIEWLCLVLFFLVLYDLCLLLVVMIGLVDSLVSYGVVMDMVDCCVLLDIILVEGECLDCYIQNLLDMIWLGYEGLKINCDWIGVDELIGLVVWCLQCYQLKVWLELDILVMLVLIWVYLVLVEQVVFNVMENVVKFLLFDVVVQVQVCELDGQLCIDVIDVGFGIFDDECVCIFDMFYSVECGD